MWVRHVDVDRVETNRGHFDLERRDENELQLLPGDGADVQVELDHDAGVGGRRRRGGVSGGDAGRRSCGYPGGMGRLLSRHSCGYSARGS